MIYMLFPVAGRPAALFFWPSGMANRSVPSRKRPSMPGLDDWSLLSGAALKRALGPVAQGLWVALNSNVVLWIIRAKAVQTRSSKFKKSGSGKRCGMLLGQVNKPRIVSLWPEATCFQGLPRKRRTWPTPHLQMLRPR